MTLYKLHYAKSSTAATNGAATRIRGSSSQETKWTESCVSIQQVSRTQRLTLRTVNIPAFGWLMRIIVDPSKARISSTRTVPIKAYVYLLSYPYRKRPVRRSFIVGSWENAVKLIRQMREEGLMFFRYEEHIYIFKIKRFAFYSWTSYTSVHFFSLSPQYLKYVSVSFLVQPVQK